jgi:arylsulfatase A-like enzyme
MASTLDLFPTIAKAAGVALPGDRVYDGHDLLPSALGGAASPRKDFYYCRGRLLEAVREGSWKYRHARVMLAEGRESADPPKGELFHLDWDPAEQYDMSSRHPEIAGRLSAKLKAFAKEIGAQLA